MIEEPRRQGALLVLLLMSNEKPVMDVKVRVSLATVTIRLWARDPKMGRKAQSQKTGLCFRRPDFGLFSYMPGRIPWDTSFERMSQEKLQASP